MNRIRQIAQNNNRDFRSIEEIIQKMNHGRPWKMIYLTKKYLNI